MSPKPKLHFHTDCDFFAGCENMLANFLNDACLREKFTITLSFRCGQRYCDGLFGRVSNLPEYRCPNVISNGAFMKWAGRQLKPLRIFARILQRFGVAGLVVLLWNVFVLWRTWRKCGIDILHINNGGYPGASSCQAAALAARMCGIKKVIMVVNNIAVSATPGICGRETAVDYLIARYTSIFVTGSHVASEAIRSRLKLPGHKVLSIHNGIASRYPDESIEDARHRLGVCSGQLVFGVVAILEPRKGHRVLIEAFYELRKQLAPMNMPVLFIEGDGSEKENLQGLVRKLRLDKHVKFIGHERNVFNFLQSIDLFILPSINYEDFPNVVLEAMSFAKPVIGTKLSGIPEQIQDGITGWLVEPGDSAGLAKLMLTAVKERDCLQIAGEAAEIRFKQMFTSRIAVTRYLELYSSLLA